MTHPIPPDLEAAIAALPEPKRRQAIDLLRLAVDNLSKTRPPRTRTVVARPAMWVSVTTDALNPNPQEAA
jgi:hypothetical protein